MTRTRGPLLRKQVLYPLSYEGIRLPELLPSGRTFRSPTWRCCPDVRTGGEGGIRTLGRGFPRQPLSRRSHSATLAPPRRGYPAAAHAPWGSPWLGPHPPRRRFDRSDSGGRGIRTPGGRRPTAVFKTAALSRSAIPPGNFPLIFEFTPVGCSGRPEFDADHCSPGFYHSWEKE